jgi:diguanylate cyclase (GGDEF)-like protein/PAS domain S-box-containing protein
VLRYPDHELSKKWTSVAEYSLQRRQKCPNARRHSRFQELTMTEISHETLLDSLFDGVYYVDCNKRILIWNRGAERITGFAKEEVIGACCAQNILRHVNEGGQELCVAGCPLSRTILDGSVQTSNIYLHHKLGHRVPVSVRTSPVRDENGAIVGAIEVFSDNSTALQILRELEEMKKEAYLDPLTTVGNRRYGEMTLATRLYEWTTHGIPCGVIFLDIDHFKQCNDTHGHQVGDDLLAMVAKTIFHALRRIDAVSRWGGEEFVILLANVTGEDLVEVAERIRMLIAHSFLMAGTARITVTASLGGTLTLPGDTPETIVMRADQLMYASKEAGRNRVTIG